MKKILTLTFCLILTLVITACGSQAGSQGGQTETSSQREEETTVQTTEEAVEDTANEADTSDASAKELQSGTPLVVYFAYSENMGDTSNMSVDAITSASLNRSTDNTEGNLQIMAQEIGEKTGAEIFHILLQEPFDPDYSTMLNGAIEQIQNSTLPPLQSKVENLEQYDVVFFGTPVWSNEIPPAVRTFLTENDLSGKTIIPFNIHLGSRFGRVVDQIKELCPDADIVEGFTVNAGTANDEVREEFSKWLDSLD